MFTSWNKKFNKRNYACAQIHYWNVNSLWRAHQQGRKSQCEGKRGRLCIKIHSWYHWYSNVTAWSSLVPRSDLTKISQLEKKKKRAWAKGPKSFQNSAKVDWHSCNIWEEALSHLGETYAQTRRDDGKSIEQGSGWTEHRWARASVWRRATQIH